MKISEKENKNKFCLNHLELTRKVTESLLFVIDFMDEL